MLLIREIALQVGSIIGIQSVDVSRAGRGPAGRGRAVGTFVRRSILLKKVRKFVQLASANLIRQAKYKWSSVRVLAGHK